MKKNLSISSMLRLNTTATHQLVHTKAQSICITLPEPSALGLLPIGMFGITFLRRRQR